MRLDRPSLAFYELLPVNLQRVLDPREMLDETVLKYYARLLARRSFRVPGLPLCYFGDVSEMVRVLGDFGRPDNPDAELAFDEVTAQAKKSYSKCRLFMIPFHCAVFLWHRRS